MEEEKKSLKNLMKKLFIKEKTNFPIATKRECEIAGLLASGLTNKETSDRLKISIKTVEKHREKIHKKNNLRNTADLTRWALANGLTKNEFSRLRNN